MACELLSPAGDFETALAAFAAGADAVYCGLGAFSARAYATNFATSDLKKLLRYSKANGKKVYITFNTLLDEIQLADAIATLGELEALGVDAIIVQDLGIARICRKYFPKLTLHASTQLVAHNLEGVLALGELGFTRVVLARELSLAEITSIAKRCGDIELEVFIHGALCYSLSGLCLFGAMEKGRSGNRGQCPYCCRMSYETEAGHKTLAFSMKDLRVGEDARKLVEAGVASLKIEGRMKSSLYVASVTKYYRQILGEDECRNERPVTIADLETVFSRRTTHLYLNGKPNESVIDSDSLGHLGTPIGVVKRVTKDREGRRWVRFHTSRKLERHDGLQFANPDGGKPFGFGVGDLRSAISRTNVFEVSAGTDVEIALPELPESEDWTRTLKSGATVYCSMSNEVKRRFPAPSFRDSDYLGARQINVELTIAQDKVTAQVEDCGALVAASIVGKFELAKNPEKTLPAAEKAFSKLGDTDYQLLSLKLNDPEKLFVPASVLNDLRRQLVEKLTEVSAQNLEQRIKQALLGVEEESFVKESASPIRRTLKLRVGESVPSGNWDEVIVAINADTAVDEVKRGVRLALPVYTSELKLNALRNTIKRFLRAGFEQWEASDLATLRILKTLEVSDITADWTLYAFNSQALKAIAELGVKRLVASPENSRDNLQSLAESGYLVECLAQQSTPLFISLTEPESVNPTNLTVFKRDGLWVTTKPTPRTFTVPNGAITRYDLSWS